MKTKSLLIFIFLSACAWGQQQLTSSTILSSGASGSVSTFTCNTAGAACWTFNTQPPAPRKKNLHTTLVQVKNASYHIDESHLAPTNYLELAKSIGLDPSVSMDEAKMLQTIYGHHLPVYPFVLVDDYLYNKAISISSSTRWVWKPLRKVDLDAMAHLNAWEGPEMGVLDPKQYAREVPANIIELAKVVLDEVPEAMLIVSDYETVKPDPFLAVTTPALLAAGKIWIVAVWDEPNFRYDHVVMGPTVSRQ